MENKKSKDGMVIELQPKVLGKLPPSGGKTDEEKEAMLIKCYVVLFGVSSLLGWNMVITAAEFYRAKVKGSTFQDSFPNYIQFIGISATMLGSLANIFISKKVNLKANVVISNIILSAPIAVITVLAGINTDSWPEIFFIINILCIAISSLGNGIHTSAMSALITMINPELMKPHYAGKGIAGILAVLVSLITVSFPGMGSENSALYFFLITTLFMAGLITFLLFKFLRLDSVKQCLVKKRPHLKDDVLDGKKVEKLSTFELFKRTKTQCFTIFLQMLVTLTVFPAISSNLQQISPSPGTLWTDKYFHLISVFLLFNLGDCAGRITSSYFIWPGRELILILSVARLIFIPMIMMCNIQPRTLPVWFNNDAYPSIIIFLTSLTMGHMLNLSIAYAPLYVEGTENRGRVSIITLLFLSGGMAVASCTTFAMTAILDN